MSKQQFRNLIDEAGIPSTEAGLKQSFQQIADDSGVVLNNDSDYSPFWRLIIALMITPVLWLLNLLVAQVLPQFFAKTATGAFLDMHAWAVDITRKDASTAAGTVVFTRESVSQALTIKAGTVIQTTPIGGTVYRVTVTADTPFPASAESVSVPVVADQPGSAHNLAAGYFAILAEPIAGVTGVRNPDGWLTELGAEQETDDALRLRIQNQFSAVNQYHTDAVYRSILASRAGISTDRIYFEHDAPRGPGTANAFVLFDAGEPGEQYTLQLNSHVHEEGNHGHGDDLQVMLMPEQNTTVTATLFIPSWYNTAQREQLLADAQQFIRVAFREATTHDYQPTQTRPWSRFSFSKLGEELHRQWPDVQAVEWGQPDIISQMTIPRLQALTLTLEDVE